MSARMSRKRIGKIKKPEVFDARVKPVAAPTIIKRGMLGFLQ